MPEETPDEPVETTPQAPENPAPEAEGEEEPFDRKRAEAALRKKNSEAENLRKRLKELEPLAKRAQELEDAQKSEAERLAEQLTAQQEKAAKAIRSAVTSKVEALAARDFADPEDAAGALDLQEYVDEDGVIDADAIKRDLAELLKRKPHWAKAAEGPRRPAPDRTQGSSGNGNRTPNSPADEFAGFMKRALNGGR
ncbi:hypothetical protein AB0K23_01535 [Streptomyces sp. NPDC049602]|uniref:hypothetical protein n=1 Tax=Streptomyces sp. NPDC049602 TaxID=3155504 RepID=UPI0034212414